MKYISLLRGINVGGSKPLPMKALTTMLLDLGMTDIITYIQSGNVIFNTCMQDAGEISQLIESSILSKFDFNVPVITLSANEFIKRIRENPYLKNSEPNLLHVSFLDEVPSRENVEKIKSIDLGRESFTIVNKLIFIKCETRFSSKSKLTNTFFESKLKVKTSTRNWRTIMKLKELAEG